MSRLDSSNFLKERLLKNTQNETFFLKSVFAEVRKSGLQGCSVRNKGSVSQSTTGPRVKMFRKKLQGQEDEGTFS